jgi:zinc transporter ZupT
LAFERTTLHEGSIELRVRNDGPDDVTIAQVLVNDAYRDFTIGRNTLGRLATTDVKIPYPWDEGLPLNIGLVTSTGVVLEHEIEVAVLTPETSPKTFLTYALLGLYIGVIPVTVGLLWLPALRRASKRWIAFFLAFTLGLLSFLLIETFAEGIELGGLVAGSLHGIPLFGIGALLAVFALEATGKWLRGRKTAQGGVALAYLIAAGIGLHNLGEGLAVAAAVAAGEVALGSFLVIGFALHNTTEGLAIVAPLGAAGTKPPIKQLAFLGLIAGAPTILGAWAGGFILSPAWTTLAFGVAAGAIAQVIFSIYKGMPREQPLTSTFGATGFAAGLLVMYATGLLVA